MESPHILFCGYLATDEQWLEMFFVDSFDELCVKKRIGEIKTSENHGNSTDDSLQVLDTRSL